MFLPFFLTLRKTGVPVSLREFLGFLAAVATGISTYDVTAFYYLSRTAMVKDERFFDRFDHAFVPYLHGEQAWLWHADGCHLIERHHAAVSIDLNRVKQAGGCTASAEPGKFGAQGFQRAVHAAAKFCDISHKMSLPF